MKGARAGRRAERSKRYAAARPAVERCDVVRVREFCGPRGGRFLVLIHSCGGWSTWRGRKPPTSLSCVMRSLRREMQERDDG